MKRSITIGCILLFIIGFAFFGLYYIGKVGDNVHQSCDYLLTLNDAEREEAVAQSLEQWEGYASVLGCFIHHDTIDRITDAFFTLQAAEQTNEEALFQQTLIEIKVLLDRLYQDEIPSIQNVF